MDAVKQINEHTDRKIKPVREAQQRARKTQLLHGRILRSIAAGQKVAQADLEALARDVAEG